MAIKGRVINATVSVYTASLSADTSEFASLYSLLSKEEKEYHRSFLNMQAGREFVFRRAMLKKIIAGITKGRAEELIFERTSEGKPFIKENPSLQFSCSASGDFFLCAVTEGISVGADIQTIAADTNHALIARQYFPPEENELLAGTSKEYSEIFLALWTRREAYLKLTGTGWKGNSQNVVLLTPELFSKTPTVIHGLSSGDNKEYKVITYNEENCIISVMVQTPQDKVPQFVFLPL